MRKMTGFVRAAPVLAGIALLVVTAGPAVAAGAAVERAKANCVVGERNDGYLGAVDGKRINVALKREMDEINLKRKAAYANLAAKRGVSVDETAVLAAERLIARAPSGQCVQNANGKWTRIR